MCQRVNTGESYICYFGRPIFICCGPLPPFSEERGGGITRRVDADAGRMSVRPSRPSVSDMF